MNFTQLLLPTGDQSTSPFSAMHPDQLAVLQRHAFQQLVASMGGGNQTGVEPPATATAADLLQLAQLWPQLTGTLPVKGDLAAVESPPASAASVGAAKNATAFSAFAIDALTASGEPTSIKREEPTADTDDDLTPTSPLRCKLPPSRVTLVTPRVSRPVDSVEQ